MRVSLSQNTNLFVHISLCFSENAFPTQVALCFGYRIHFAICFKVGVEVSCFVHELSAFD